MKYKRRKFSSSAVSWWRTVYPSLKMIRPHSAFLFTSHLFVIRAEAPSPPWGQYRGLSTLAGIQPLLLCVDVGLWNKPVHRYNEINCLPSCSQRNNCLLVCTEWRRRKKCTRLSSRCTEKCRFKLFLHFNWLLYFTAVVIWCLAPADWEKSKPYSLWNHLWEENIHICHQHKVYLVPPGICNFAITINTNSTSLQYV